MSIQGPDDRAMHDALNRLSRQADIDNAHIDLAAVNDGIQRGRRRRELRQRTGVGAMALVLIGGLSFGGYQLFGGNGEGGEVAGPPRELASEFPSWEDTQCEAVFPELKHAGNEPRLVTADFSIDFAQDGVPVNYELIGLDLDFVSGKREATAVTDLGVWLINPVDGERFTGGSTGHLSGVVVKDGRVVGIPGPMVQPWFDHDLEPGTAIPFSAPYIEPCPSFDGTFTGEEEIYFVLDAVSLDGESTRVWGGPWYITSDGSTDPDGSEFTELQTQCSAYPLSGGGDSTDDAGCPLTVSAPTWLLEQRISVDELVSAEIKLGHGLSGVDTVSGTLRPQALVEIRDADGNIVNPEIGHSDDNFDDFSVTPEEPYYLPLLSGIAPDDTGPITLEPGLYDIVFTVDVQLDTAEGEGLRLTTFPVTVEVYDPNESVSSEPQEPVAPEESPVLNAIDRSELPVGTTIATPICTFYAGMPDGDEWQGECPFSVHTTLGATAEPYAIENVTSWLVLDENVYTKLDGNYGSTSLQMEIRDADGEVVVPGAVFGDMMLRYLNLTTDNAWAIPASIEARTYDWDGLAAGDYTAHFTLNLGLDAIEFNPDFEGTPSAPEIIRDEDSGWHYALETTWDIDFTVN